MLIIKIFFYLISPFFLLILIIISPFLEIRFFFLSTERIGELVYQVEAYHLLQKKKLKKKIDIFILGHIISNRFFIKLLEKKLLILSGVVAFPIFRQIKFFSTKINFFKKFLIEELEGNNLLKNFNNGNIVFNKENQTTIMPDSFLKKGEIFLKSIGINESDKIILLLVRDSEYLKLKFPGQDFNYHNHRDCDINNFIPAIKSAIKKGYYVFRMGERVKKKIKLDNSNFIDYSNLYRTDYLDVYLSFRCSFIISTGAGFDALPAITFRKPMLSTNGIPIKPMVLHPCAQLIYSLKHHFDKTNNKNISINEIFDLNLSYATRSNDFSKKNIHLVENKSEDIEEMVNNFIYLQENNNLNSDHEYSLLQKKINLIFKKKLNLSENCSDFRSKISEPFIKKYKYFIHD